MRDITKVIDQILAVVPETETTARAALASVRSTAAFGAPELQGSYWNQLHGVLVRNLGHQPTEPWHFEVAAIMRGERPI